MIANANKIDFLPGIREIIARKINLTMNNCMSVAKYHAREDIYNQSLLKAVIARNYLEVCMVPPLPQNY